MGMGAGTGTGMGMRCDEFGMSPDGDGDGLNLLAASEALGHCTHHLICHSSLPPICCCLELLAAVTAPHIRNPPQPDAKERFIEAKRAFEALADDAARSDYDRQLRMVRTWLLRRIL